MPTTYYVALPFIDSEDGPVPAEAVECQSASDARRRASAMARDSKYVGAVAFQRSGEPDIGEFSDAVILERYGQAPDDLSAL